MASRRVAPAANAKGPKTRRFMKELPVGIFGEAYVKLAEKHAAKALEVSVLEQKKKDAAKDFTARVNVARAEVDALRTATATHQEQRQVECEEIADFDTNRFSIKRLDTGEQIDDRAMTADERDKHLAAAQTSLIKEDDEG